MVKLIDKEEYMEIIEKNQDQGKMMVIDYFSDGCSPCKMMETIVEKAQEKYPQIEFYKINISSLLSKDIQALGITSVPTFVFSKNSSSYGVKTGAVPPSVFNAYIEQYCLNKE